MATFNTNFKIRSDGLATCQPGQIQYGSQSCSHTNYFVCCVLPWVQSSQPNLCIDNRMSQGMLSEQDPGIARALTDGLSWTVVKAEVATFCPSLPDFIQKARNDPGRAQRQ